VIRTSGYIGTATPLALALAAAVVIGCSSSTPTLIVPNPSAPLGLPAPAAAGPVNTYSGVQSPGAWTLTLDNAKNTFSYQPVTYPATPNTPVSGSILVTNGFTQLTNNGTAAGYVLEVMGRFAILRPGGVNSAAVFSVPETSCYQVTGRSRFQYLGIPANINAGPTLGYGSVVASTDSTGKSWQFENMQGNIVQGPASFSATCGGAGNQVAISFTGQQSVLNTVWANPSLIPTPTTDSSISIGPSGFFVADQSDPTQGLPTGASVAGVIEPLSALSSSDMTSKQYLGFVYQEATTIGVNGVPPTPPLTSPVSFGLVGSSGTTLLGGDFPNDDVTQPPNSDMSINLGKQDTTYNGIYLNASITVLDPAQNCANYQGGGETATTGLNAQGYPTCTFPGIAVAGNPEGKYAIFITAYNWAARLDGAPMQIYLLQQ
jgi:hypothetical protein